MALSIPVKVFIGFKVRRALDLSRVLRNLIFVTELDDTIALEAESDKPKVLSKHEKRVL